MRLFAAVELDPDARKALAAHATQLASRLSHPSGEWKPVGPGLVHVTVKFLGEVAPPRVDGLLSALGGAAVSVPPFRLIVEGHGAFPDPGHARVVWAGISEGAAELARLAAVVDTACVALGFAREERPFSAHLTLARLGRKGRPTPVSSALASAALPGLEPQFVRELALFESRSTGPGPAYLPLATVPLGARA